MGQKAPARWGSAATTHLTRPCPGPRVLPAGPSGTEGRIASRSSLNREAVFRSTPAMVVLGILTAVAVGGCGITGGKNVGALPKRFSASTPSVALKTGDEIARIRAGLGDPNATSV